MPGTPGAEFHLEFVDRFIGALKERVAAMEAANDGMIREAAYATEREAKRRVAEGGRHKKGTPTPAQYGSGPAVITGNLRRSIRTGHVVHEGFGNLSVRVGPTAVYGRRVELDYDYPYMGPTVAAMQAEVQRIAIKWYRRALSG